MTLSELTTLQHMADCKDSAIARDKGPDYVAKTKFSDSTDTGLEKCIEAFLNIMGHEVEVVRNSGRVLPAKKVKSAFGNTITLGTDKYIPGSGKNGTPDLHSGIYIAIGKYRVPIRVGWEVKIGKDRQQPSQIEYQKYIESRGGFYFIVKTWDEFYSKYELFINQFQ